MAKRSTGAFLALAMSGFLPFMAVCQADDRPRWDVGEICASSGLGLQCPKIESENRRSVLNRWEAVPEAARTACAGQVSQSGKPSYKALLTCLEESQLKTLEKRSEADLTRPGAG